MATYNKAVEPYKKAVTTAASLAALAMLVRGMVNELVPFEVREFLFSGLGYLQSRMSSQHKVVIEENEGWATNQLYDAARMHVPRHMDQHRHADMQCLRVSRVDEGKALMFTMEEGQKMAEVHGGAELRWRLVCRDNAGTGANNGNSGRGGNGNYRVEVRSFEMSFHKKHKDKAITSYLPHILATAKTIKEQAGLRPPRRCPFAAGAMRHGSFGPLPGRRAVRPRPSVANRPSTYRPAHLLARPVGLLASGVENEHVRRDREKEEEDE